MADAHGFVRGETLDIFLAMFDENELGHLFEEKIDNIRREVIIHIFSFILSVQIFS